jgi:hypothetical protein
MGNIRMLIDAEFIVVDKEGKQSPFKFEYGCYYPALLIEKDTATGYANVHLSNGTQLVGIDRTAFHNFGVEEILTTSTEETVQ